MSGIVGMIPGAKKLIHPKDHGGIVNKLIYY